MADFGDQMQWPPPEWAEFAQPQLPPVVPPPGAIAAPPSEIAQPVLPPPPAPVERQLQQVEPTPSDLAAFDKFNADEAAQEDAAWAKAHPEPDATSGADPRAGVDPSLDRETAARTEAVAPSLAASVPQVGDPNYVASVDQAAALPSLAGGHFDADGKWMPSENRSEIQLPSVGAEQSADAGEKQSEYYATHPFALARDNQAAEQAKRSQTIAETLRLSLENEKRARAEYDAHQAAKAKTAQELAAIRNTKIDPEQHLGLQDSILNVIALTLGGAVSAKTGGRNLALEQLNKAIDNNIDAQKANLANRRMAAAEGAQAEADNYREATAFRVGAYNAALQSLQTKMQDFDAHGSQVRELGAQYGQILAAKNQTEQKAEQTLFDNNFKTLAPLVQKQEEINETALQHDREYAEKMAKLKTGSLANENQLVAGLSPKDRERAVFSPDGKTYRLAVDHETAVKQRDEIGSGNAAVHAADSVIADLSNDTGLMAKLKAKAGLNPQELAVLKSKLSLLKPMIAKVAAGTGRIPLAELHAVDAATDDPSAFTSETLAQIRAMRDATVNDLSDKFEPEYPGFIAKGSFGHAPQIAEPPNINTIMAPLLSAAPIGNKGAGRIDVSNVDATLKQAAQEYNANPGLGGGKEYASQLDDAKAAQVKAIAAIEADSAKLSKKPKRTADDNARLHQNALAVADRQQVIRAIDDAKEQSIVVDVKQAKAKQDDLAHKLIHPSEPR